jgi:hypothetical protein
MSSITRTSYCDLVSLLLLTILFVLMLEVRLQNASKQRHRVKKFAHQENIAYGRVRMSPSMKWTFIAWAGILIAIMHYSDDSLVHDFPSESLSSNRVTHNDLSSAEVLVAISRYCLSSFKLLQWRHAFIFFLAQISSFHESHARSPRTF